MDPDSEAYADDTTDGEHDSKLERWLDNRAKIYYVTRKMRHRLNQTEFWIDGAGRKIRIESIDPRYAENIIKYLERIAKFLHSGEEAAYLFGPVPTADMAELAFTQESQQLFETPPLEWLRQKPLYRAIKQQCKIEAPPRTRSAFARAA